MQTTCQGRARLLLGPILFSILIEARYKSGAVTRHGRVCDTSARMQ